MAGVHFKEMGGVVVDRLAVDDVGPLGQFLRFSSVTGGAAQLFAALLFSVRGWWRGKCECTDLGDMVCGQPGPCRGG